MVASAFQVVVSLLALTSVSLGAISQDLLQKFELYNQYTAATYCANDNDIWGKPNRLITCKSGNCPLVEKNKATVLNAMTEIMFSSIAILALDPVEKNLGACLLVYFRLLCCTHES